MRRGEALIAASAGVAMVAAGAAWAFGPWGLLGVGAAVLVVVVFVVDVREG